MEQHSAPLDPVLVIGGCGGLGRHVLTSLLEDGQAQQITVFDLIPPSDRINGVQYVQGNLANEEDILSIIQKLKPRTVFHTASPKMMRTPNPALFDEVNIGGTRALLNALKDQPGTKLLVYTSSSSVSHDNRSDLIEATEDRPHCLEPEQPEHYTHTKAIAETMVLEANGLNGLWTASLQPCTLFGEYDTLTIPYMVELARAGRTKYQIGDNTNAYDYTYMGNMAYAEVLAAQALSRESSDATLASSHRKVNGEAFVITNDEHWTFWQLPRAVGAAAGYPTREEDIWHIPFGVYYTIAVVSEWVVWLTSFGQRQANLNRKMLKFTVMTRTFDISKAKERLQYRPKIGMQQAVEKSVKWYMEQKSGKQEK